LSPIIISDLPEEFIKFMAEHPERPEWEAKELEMHKAGLRLSKEVEQAFTSAKKILPLFEHGDLNDFYTMEPVNGLTLLAACSMINDDSKSKAIKTLNSARGKNAADKGHAKNRERKQEIKEIWATGKYTTRDICAEEEYEGLGYKTFGTARKALQGTPDPRKI
jgi:hypothetical protein